MVIDWEPADKNTVPQPNTTERSIMINPTYEQNWGEFRSTILTENALRAEPLSLEDTVGGITYAELVTMPADQPFKDKTVPVLDDPDDLDYED